MHSISRIGAALVLCCLGFRLFAQDQLDPTGYWRHTAETEEGEVSTTVRLDYIDGELLGSLRNSQIGAQLLLHDGVLDGNKVSFKLQLLTRVLQYEGDIVDNEMTLAARVIEGEPLPDGFDAITISLTRSE